METALISSASAFGLSSASALGLSSAFGLLSPPLPSGWRGVPRSPYDSPYRTRPIWTQSNDYANHVIE